MGMKLLLKGLFGGTFGYVQAALIIAAGGALIFLWQDYKGAKADVARLGNEVTKPEGAVASKDLIISSIDRTATLRGAEHVQSK